MSVRKCPQPIAIGVGVALLLLLLGLVACEGPTPENGNAGDPLVWPQAARLGDSVGWVISSDRLFSPQQAATPFFTWSRENVAIGLIDDLGYEAPPLVPRVVFEAQSAVGARMRGGRNGLNAGVIIALFDLPAVWPNTANPLPQRFDLALYVEGQQVDSWTNSIEILGDGGAPIVFAIPSSVDVLGPEPMLRLRPRWDQSARLGIDPNWQIAGIEFTLRYPEPSEPIDGSITQPRAIPTGAAATALCLAGSVTAEGNSNRVKINVLAPDGIELGSTACDPSGCYAGRTSLIDIAFDKDSGTLPVGTPVFDAGDFGIEDLKIVDPSGVKLNTSADASDYFDLFVVDNLAEGP